MKKLVHSSDSREELEISLSATTPGEIALPPMLDRETSNQLIRMFRDPGFLSRVSANPWSGN